MGCCPARIRTTGKQGGLFTRGDGSTTMELHMFGGAHRGALGNLYAAMFRVVRFLGPRPD